jgi:hypothetical protein
VFLFNSSLPFGKQFRAVPPRSAKGVRELSLRLQATTTAPTIYIDQIFQRGNFQSYTESTQSFYQSKMAVPNSLDTDFRRHLPDLKLPRFTTMQSQEAHGYADAFKSSGQPPWLHGLYLHWRKLYEEPYHGITNDGMGSIPLVRQEPVSLNCDFALTSILRHCA